jgi:hypothetical protein
VTLDDRGETVWTLIHDGVAQVSTAHGKILRKFAMEDVIAANPGTDILAIRQDDYADLSGNHKNTFNDFGGNDRNTSEAWLMDRFHLNDVEPLPRHLAARFDGFEAGDLLLSVRSLNLLFVIDPNSLKVKWWRMGMTRRQHDPDWSETGEITAFDNRLGRDYSRIVSIAPKSFEERILFDGQKNNFYSRFRGKHQITETGNLLVTSTQQGRVFEVDPNGKVVLEILNRKPGDSEFNYLISQATWLPVDYFKFTESKRCGS